MRRLDFKIQLLFLVIHRRPIKIDEKINKLEEIEIIKAAASQNITQ